MARFRNRLVHLYWNVDAAQVYEYLQTAMGEFDSFSQSVSAFLSRSPSGR